MQDHYQARIVCKCRFPITVNDIMLSKTRMVKTGLQYLLFRKGPLTIAAAQAGLFARTRQELATPDVQYATVVFSADRPAEGLHKFSGFSLVGYQLRPESRGELKLKSPNPADPPAMHAELSRHRNRSAHHHRWTETRTPPAGARRTCSTSSPANTSRATGADRR